jgi:hypothetical protein
MDRDYYFTDPSVLQITDDFSGTNVHRTKGQKSNFPVESQTLRKKHNACNTKTRNAYFK